MKRLFTLFIVLISINSFINRSLAATPPKILARINISGIEQIPALAQFSISIHLRMPSYVVATLTKENLKLISAAGYQTEIIDETLWSEPYYLVTKQPPQGQFPAVGEIISQTDREAVVKISENEIQNFKRAGFEFFKLSPEPLPFDVPSVDPQTAAVLTQLDDPIVNALVNRVSLVNLQIILQRLQDFRTRFSGSDSVYAASQWIYDQFASWGYQVQFDTLGSYVEGNLQRNVIATKTGVKNPGKYVVVGGHYDSIVLDGANPLIWAPGVDDNGTAVALTLELARILADIDLDKSVIFACWAAEEQGLIGSADWARKAKRKNLDIEVYMNYDMIGNVDPLDPELNYDIQYDRPGNIYAQLMKDMVLLYTNLVPYISAAGGSSDHASFMQQGYTIVHGVEGDFSPNWHRSTDTIDNIDLDYLTQVVRAGLGAFVHVAGPPASIGLSYVAYNHYFLDDDASGQSIGNHNGFVDPGETLEIYFNIKNIGNSPVTGVSTEVTATNSLANILIGTQLYGDMAAGDSLTNAAPFVIHVSENAANDQTLVFLVKIHDSQNNSWESYFMLKVKQPDLRYASYTLVEVTGDGDQIPDNGEVLNLFVNLQNKGLRAGQGIHASLQSYDADVTLIDAEATFPDASLDATVTNLADPFTFLISGTALQHQVLFKLNLVEGDGYYQREYTVSVLLKQGKILLVEDDGAQNETLAYQNTLSQLGVPFTTWSVAENGAVPTDTLTRFNEVIWYVGLEARETLSEAERTNLAQYLDQGGKLLLSGDFIGYRLNTSTFLKDYLHGRFTSLQSQVFDLKAVPDNPVTDVSPFRLSNAAGNWPTEISPIAPAFPVFAYPTAAGTASKYGAIAVDNDTFKVVFCSFQIETMLDPDIRTEFMEDVLGWFKGSPLDLRPIPEVSRVMIDDDSLGASSGDGDGFVNPGETIELTLELVNAGNLVARALQAVFRSTTSQITLIDSVTAFGDILSKATALAEFPVTFQVHPDAPNQHRIEFEVVVRDSAGNRWELPLAVPVEYSGTVSGRVYDLSSLQGIPQTSVYWYADANPEIYGSVSANTTGSFHFSVPIGAYTVFAGAPGFLNSDPIQVVLPPDTQIDFAMTAPVLAVSRDSLVMHLNAGEIRQDSIMISNPGTGKLYFTVTEEEPEITGSALALPDHSLKMFGIRSVKFRIPENFHTTASVNRPPNPLEWKLVAQDSSELDSFSDLKDLYIQGNQKDLYFKQTFYRSWGNHTSDLAYIIFIDADANVATGNNINRIGADFAISVGSFGNLVFQWIPANGGFSPASSPQPHHLNFQPQADSLEIGITRLQIGNPERIKYLCVTMHPNGTLLDIIPDYINCMRYAFIDVAWLDESQYFGLVQDSFTLGLTFDATGLTPGNYQASLVLGSNAPVNPEKTLPVRLNVGGVGVTGDLFPDLPKTFALAQNYPNPFSPAPAIHGGTLIKFQLPEPQRVTIKIFNMLGQEVATLLDLDHKAGFHQVTWNGRFMNGQIAAAGVYFYQILAGDFSQTRKMLILH